MNLSESELVSALQDEAERKSEDNGFMTMEEIRKLMGWSKDKTYDHMRALDEKGMLEVGRVVRMNLDRHPSLRTAYKLKTPPMPG